MSTIPDTQRALVLQGGGALGAYEAGAFKAIYDRFFLEAGKESVSLFDVIAGTSAGALSAAVLINHYVKKNSWKNSADELVAFWTGLKSISIADVIIGMNPFVRNNWDYLHAINPKIASGEAARRFWSSFQFDFTNLGVPNAYLPRMELNYKFLNPYSLSYWRYDYTRLRNYLKDFIDFPIKTSSDKGQPRLLVVSTDVQDYSSPVTFDSYEKTEDPKTKNNELVTDTNGKTTRWYSEYGKDDVKQEKHVVFYDGGLGLDQLIASALGKYALDHPYMEDKITNTKRQFWDGGYLSNTPLRELVQSHRTYWMNHRLNASNKIKKVPDLEVYIVDLHAITQKTFPSDLDSIDDREHDILFHNKTKYDEKIAEVIADYVSLAEELILLARQNGVPESKIERLLDSRHSKKPMSKKRDGRSRAYRDLLDGRFKIIKLWHLERKDDPDTIYGKFTDFSFRSIDSLIAAGDRDANRLLSKAQ
jgi:NTE family protein